MATTTGTAASALPAAGGTSTQGLADWAAPYVTNYLGKAQALGDMPYQAYQGPLTAGPSALQTQAFSGIGSLTVPSGIGEAATRAGTLASNAPGAYTSVGGSFTDTGVAGQYMNPYLQQALTPTLDEIRRQSQISSLGNAARMTGAGAFGGSRQAILDAETQRNLLNTLGRTTGEGYATAYDKAAQQYNAEQARKIQEAQFGANYGLEGLRQQLAATQLQGQLNQTQAEQQRANLAQQLAAGAAQRGITSEGVAADLGEFQAQREFPYKQLQFQRDMISGLPTSSVTNTPAQLSGIAQLAAAAGGIESLLKATGKGNLADLLDNLGFNFGGSESV